MRPTGSTTGITLVPDDETDGRVLQFERTYDHPPQRLWDALTTDEQISAWYPTKVEIDPRPGGRMLFTFPGADDGDPGQVLRVAEPSLLEYAGGGEKLRWRLHPEADGSTRVVFTTSLRQNPGHANSLAAGYDLCLEQLATMLDSGIERVQRTEMPPPDDLVAHYTSELDLTADL